MKGDSHGYGIYRWPDGPVYYGQWKQDKRDGYGYDRNVDGIEYYGQYKDEKK